MGFKVGDIVMCKAPRIENTGVVEIVRDLGPAMRGRWCVAKAKGKMESPTEERDLEKLA